MSTASAQFFLLISFAGGLAIPYQAAINGLLSKYLHHPLQASAVNFVGGAVFIALLLLYLQPALPAMDNVRKIPWYLFCGGILGAFFVTAALIAVPRIGGTTFLAAMFTGQMVGAVIMDHYGLLNVSAHPVSLTRIAGIGLLAAGMYLVHRG